ncbi:uncharacterized protein BDV14DRAFT_173243, partial [Aspergillus stella-maris]|uniref:uncharacterized protein n=1 Tax=Aspergillus stella-maris TaxID=1810926 RepID=UPI003CCE0C4B
MPALGYRSSAPNKHNKHVHPFNPSQPITRVLGNAGIVNSILDLRFVSQRDGL